METEKRGVSLFPLHMSHKNKDDTVTCVCVQLYSNCARCTSCVFPNRGTFLLAEDLYAYSKRVCVCVCVFPAQHSTAQWGLGVFLYL